MVRVVRIISSGDKHSGNIWFLWSKQSNYQEKLRCHVCDERTKGQKVEKMQYSGIPENAISYQRTPLAFKKARKELFRFVLTLQVSFMILPN